MNRSLHSSSEELPLRYSVQPIVSQYTNLHRQGTVLSEYHFKKQVSYFLQMVIGCRCVVDGASYSLISLHSGANDADILFIWNLKSWMLLDNGLRRVSMLAALE